MRLSLRRKIVGGYGLLVFLVVVLGWVTLSLFSSVRTVQSRAFDESVPGLVAVDEIVRSYTAQSAAIRGYLIQARPALLEQYEIEVQTSRLWEQRALELFEEGEERELLEQVIAAGAEFHDLIEDRVIPLIEQDKRVLAFSVLGQEGAALTANIESMGSLLQRNQEQVLIAIERELVARSNQAVLILVLVLIAVLVIGIILTIFLPRRLATNLSRLVEAARGIERGDLDQRIDIRSGDEIEELGDRFQEMQSGLKRLQQLSLQNRELEIAASIQQNLLQSVMPYAPGVELVPLHRQANLVGGDWYDVDASRDVLSVVIGDASGKGIAAALMATVVLSVIRAERRLGADAKRIVKRANEALREATESDSFTTAIYATLDLVTGYATWLNMGHPSPFVLRAGTDGDGAAGSYFEGERNRALGWFEDPGLVETRLRLEPGDRLVLYTDGFLEAKSPEGEIFGEERFAEALVKLRRLPAGRLEDEIVREVEEFAAGKLSDDLTMLVIEFRGVPLREGVPAERTGEDEWPSRR